MTDRGHDAATSRPDDALEDAFRALHGPRLHGFALLLTLGDRAQAASLAADALGRGMARVDQLRHPERAAAWLRRRVVERAEARRGRVSEDAERTLAEMGADRPVVVALSALTPTERAALIASTIERLDRRDVGTVVGRNGPDIDRLVQRARARYLAASDATAAGATPMTGPIVMRITEAARTALA